MFKTSVVLCLASLALLGCSANVSTDTPLSALGDTRELKNTNDPLSGTVDGAAWSIGKAIAKDNRNGEYSITIAGQGVALTCPNFMPLAPHISFVVPKAVGSYAYDGSAGGRLVNFIFPYRTATAGGSDNILGAKSLIQINLVNNALFEGNLAALSPVSLSHSYEIAGSFKAEICP